MGIQFGIARLLVLTAAVAVVLAISVRIQASMLTQGVIVGYFLILTVWLVMRGPNVVSGLAGVYWQLIELKKRRSELEIEVLARKAILEKSFVEASMRPPSSDGNSIAPWSDESRPTAQDC